MIDEASAIHLEETIVPFQMAPVCFLEEGAKALSLEPTVIADTTRDRDGLQRIFCPLAPIMGIEDIDDAIACANSTPYGLSSGVITQHMGHALKAVRELRCGTVNINEVLSTGSNALPLVASRIQASGSRKASLRP